MSSKPRNAWRLGRLDGKQDHLLKGPNDANGAEWPRKDMGRHRYRHSLARLGQIITESIRRTARFAIKVLVQP